MTTTSTTPASDPLLADPVLVAVLRDVLANPDDDTPRLVYADRLEELGMGQRAEFIRVQVELAAGVPWEDDMPWYRLKEREQALYSMRLGWAHPFEGDLSWFRRGFVESVTLTAADWLAHADAVTAAHPVTKVTLTTLPILEKLTLTDRYVEFQFPGRRVRRMEGRNSVQTDGAGMKEMLEREWQGIEFNVPADPPVLITANYSG